MGANGKVAWVALLERIPAPEVVGIGAAVSECWPSTRIQRCYFHIFESITRHLTMRPRLEAGKELRALTRALMQVLDLDQATAWLVEYAAWESRWETFLTHPRTPASIASGRRDWARLPRSDAPTANCASAKPCCEG
ncbi:MULE transposase [Cutibacterium modestum 30N]|uniref:Mutator family transposase n=2 Tax=Cutibacterium modestum TaxID=2559073 RepID=A0AAD1KN50_9ACTN|nr:hypothetical protein BCB70_11130 [Cutibacterium modestum]EFS74328.1 hypothetical protein HMPREF9621_01247 [Cutibacterium modestum HL037PA2]EFS91954.1 hypothetical protein HMPREF9607_01820 [Cutibacterium modestum HL044PA1]EFT16220.1 hypothetical protein HMPREF9622_00674 [Cutibacterium modestum HL037PA3]MCP2375060.1 MULE transposase [Cutibacterium modestum 28N]MCP2377265.1 MULE transposase [Cutibacterium modestum 31N]MCP2379846.1 MULE transposase [Cutibacterium modestum 30N]